VRKDPAHPDGWWQRGDCRAGLGDTTAAEADLRAAIERAADRLDFRLGLARFLTANGRARDAIAALWLADERANVGEGQGSLDRLRLLREIHRLALELNDLEMSRRALEAARAHDPDNAAIHLELGVVLYRAGDPVAAAAALDQALERAGELTPAARAEAHYRRGLIHSHRTELEDARRHLQRAVTLAPGHAGAWRALASVRGRLDDTAGRDDAIARFRALARDGAAH